MQPATGVEPSSGSSCENGRRAPGAATARVPITHAAASRGSSSAPTNRPEKRSKLFTRRKYRLGNSQVTPYRPLPLPQKIGAVTFRKARQVREADTPRGYAGVSISCLSAQWSSRLLSQEGR
jgi:hypothetical protein